MSQHASTKPHFLKFQYFLAILQVHNQGFGTEIWEDVYDDTHGSIWKRWKQVGNKTQKKHSVTGASLNAQGTEEQLEEKLRNER